MYCEKKISRSMRERKHISCRLELKSLDMQGRFAGYASVFNIIDHQRDIMIRSAFAKTLKGRIADVKLLWQHQQEEPIGVFDRIFEDTRGLYVEGRLLLDVSRAKEAYALLKVGAISGLSIGYSPVRYTIDQKTGVRMLTEVDLWEISLVTFPANASANVTVVKHSESESAHQKQQIVRLAKAFDDALMSLAFLAAE